MNLLTLAYRLAVQNVKYGRVRVHLAKRMKSQAEKRRRAIMSYLDVYAMSHLRHFDQQTLYDMAKVYGHWHYETKTYHIDDFLKWFDCLPKHKSGRLDMWEIMRTHEYLDSNLRKTWEEYRGKNEELKWRRNPEEI